jgi:hypothetical protein
MLRKENASLVKILRFWPIWTAVGFPILVIVLEATPIAPNFVFVMMGLPSLWLMWAASALCAAILTIRWLRRRDWWQAGICIVLPLVVLWAGLNSSAFIRFCNNAGDAVHFYVRYPSFMKAVREPSTNGDPRLMTFNLGGMVWASRGFVYDESDEILRESSKQSPSWKAHAQESELGCGYGAIPMPGPYTLAKHWYIASFPC